MAQLSQPYLTTGKTIALTIQPIVDSVMYLLLNTLSRFVIAFLPRSYGAKLNGLLFGNKCILSGFRAPGWHQGSLETASLPGHTSVMASRAHLSPMLSSALPCKECIYTPACLSHSLQAAPVLGSRCGEGKEREREKDWSVLHTTRSSTQSPWGWSYLWIQNNLRSSGNGLEKYINTLLSTKAWFNFLRVYHVSSFCFRIPFGTPRYDYLECLFRHLMAVPVS